MINQLGCGRSLPYVIMYQKLLFYNIFIIIISDVYILWILCYITT